MYHSPKLASWKSMGKLVSENKKVFCTAQRGLTFITCFTWSPWLQILSKRSQRLAIKVFSSTPVMLTSPCPSSTASRPIFSTSILLVYKESVSRIRQPQWTRSHATGEGCGHLHVCWAGRDNISETQIHRVSPPYRYRSGHDETRSLKV